MGNKSKPLIGVVHGESFDYFPETRGVTPPEFVRYVASKPFYQALTAAGALPMGVGYEEENIPEILEVCDGLMLTGGDSGMPKDWYVDDEESDLVITPRVPFEFKLLTEFAKTGKPVFGICHGMQVMAAYLGGKITVNLTKHFPEAIEHRPDSREYRHVVSIDSGTHISRSTGKREMTTNSRHFQAVVKPSDNMIVSARTSDGVIEAIEARRNVHPYMVGVQHHPEFMVAIDKDPDNASIFRGFVETCELAA